MAKRTKAQIAADCQRCLDYKNNNPNASIQEIANALNLTTMQVRKSLSKSTESCSPAPHDAKTSTKKPDNRKKKKSRNKDAVIDASIVGSDDFFTIIGEIYNGPKKIVLNNLSIMELDKIKSNESTSGERARCLLALAAEDNEHRNFKWIEIEKTHPYVDHCILDYCKQHKKTVILYTSDHSMVSLARSYEIEVKYVKIAKSQTLIVAKIINNHLCIPNLDSQKDIFIKVKSNGNEYTSGDVELHVGDEVYVAKIFSDNSVIFQHFEITSLDQENNAKCIFKKIMKTSKEIPHVVKADYKAFLRDFKRKSNWE